MTLQDDSLSLITEYYDQDQDEVLFKMYLQSTLEAAVKAKSDLLTGVIGDNVPDYYKYVDAKTLDWAAIHSADLVKQITEETRAGLAETIYQGIKNGLDMQKLGREIRPDLLANDIGTKLDMFAGLNSQRIQSCLKYEEQLISEGRDAKQVESMLETFAKKQLKDRGETIARTETAKAYTEGSKFQAQRLGASEKRIIAGPNECEICQENAAVGWISVDEDFPNGDVPTHPNCKCAVSHRGIDESRIKEEFGD